MCFIAPQKQENLWEAGTSQTPLGELIGRSPEPLVGWSQTSAPSSRHRSSKWMSSLNIFRITGRLCARDIDDDSCGGDDDDSAAVAWRYCCCCGQMSDDFAVMCDAVRFTKAWRSNNVSVNLSYRPSVRGGSKVISRGPPSNSLPPVPHQMQCQMLASCNVCNRTGLCLAFSDAAIEFDFVLMTSVVCM